MSRVVVDSSVLVAYYWARDSQHTEAIRVMDELASASLIVHPYVIQEVATVLTKRLGLSVAKRFLSEIREGSNVEIPWVDVQADMHAFRSVTTPLSFTDITLIRLARSTNTALITFDRKMLALFAKTP